MPQVPRGAPEMKPRWESTGQGVSTARSPGRYARCGFSMIRKPHADVITRHWDLTALRIVVDSVPVYHDSIHIEKQGMAAEGMLHEIH